MAGVLVLGLALAACPDGGTKIAARTPGSNCKYDDSKSIPRFGVGFFESRARAWANYTRRVAKLDEGYVYAEGSTSPGTGGHGGNIAFYPHSALCTVSDTAVGTNDEGQIIGYMQWQGTTTDPEWRMQPGEVAHLVVQRESSGDVTLWLIASDGSQLNAWPYIPCHANAATDGHAGKRYAWGHVTTACDIRQPDWVNTWPQRHPNALGSGPMHMMFHDDPAWFACDEGCCIAGT